MKHIFFSALFLIAYSAFSQCPPSSKPIVSRETSLRVGYSAASQDTVFFKGVTETFLDGTTRYCEEIVRDTVALVNELTNTAIIIAKRFNQTANEVWEYPAVISGILQANTLLGQFGTSVMEQSVLRYKNQVDSTTWEIATSAGTAVGTITAHPNGMQFRLTVGVNNYNLLPVGDTIFRVMSYPTGGTSTDFFRLNGVARLEFRTIDYIENVGGTVTSGIRITKQKNRIITKK